MSTDIDPISVINAVRERQGREPINPFHIEGFGPDEGPPMREFPDLPEGSVEFAPTHSEFKSPLVPEGFPLAGSEAAEQPTTTAPPVNMAAGLDMPDLRVWGTAGTFGDINADLDATDVAAVATIILRAAQRRVASRLNELKGRPQPGPEKQGDSAPSVPAETKAPRKRGRPKGSKNKPKIVASPEPTPDN